MNHRRQLLLGLVLALAVLPGCKSRSSHFHPHVVDRVPRIEIVEPMLHTHFPMQIELAATVMPLETTVLSARVPGIVGSLPDDVDIGRRVKAGETLIQLAVPDLEADKKAREALLEQAKNNKALSQASQLVAARELDEARKLEAKFEADHTFRKLEYERIASLTRAQALTPQREEEARNQLEAAASAWAAAKAQVQTKLAKIQAAAADLEVAESKIKVAEAEVHRLAVSLSYASIAAPYDGVITKRWVDRGAMVKDAGAPLLTVMRCDQVRVVVDVPEMNVPLVNATEQNPNPDGKGDPIQLEIPALKQTADNRPFVGHITRISESLDPATRTMRAEAILDNKEGLLRPGMYGTVTVLLEQRENVLTVPSTALVRRGKQVEIYYVEDSDAPDRGFVRRAQVEIGADDGRRVQVRGLTGKEKIIAKGNGMVREGDEVTPVPLR
jgi:RND family efflux transporter MFP subunit